MATRYDTVRDFCRAILESGDLADKLHPPCRADAGALDDREPGLPLFIDRPARCSGLAMGGGAAPLPRPGELREAEARIRCLARFAHHELMAVELFAWALLRWPELPGALREGFLAALVDEQRHCSLYLERLRAHGSSLVEHAPHSDYFWRQLPAIATSPHGVQAFLAAMGLTFEQANLDFALLYRDAFREAGDAESAAALQQVHDEEIGHVALAAHWMRKLDPGGRSLAPIYLEAVPFPLSPARAKARRFEVRARRKAGLDEEFIELVRNARSSQETGGARTRRNKEG
jgi:uncharacterized ferritin-like protein (DUF455 family)